LLSELQASEHDKFAAHLYRSRKEYRSACDRAGKSGKPIERCVISTKDDVTAAAVEKYPDDRVKATWFANYAGSNVSYYMTHITKFEEQLAVQISDPKQYRQQMLKFLDTLFPDRFR
jgi:hypothetical protein